ncbi:protein FAM204A [Bombina bombina]|uniref:protein FAM204A n=1 Tax=Bombina bombina TaxID=8345 RepID=UPI00235AD0C6|nr:protein FAM204A [Bombina bombina]
MWSGLLPPGVTESDVSDEEDVTGEPVSTHDGTSTNKAPESSETEQHTTVCPGGVPVSCWNKFLDLQKKCSEIKSISSRKEKRKRRRRGRGQLKQVKGPEKNSSPPTEKVAALDTLQQYFGINDRFEPPVCTKILKKSKLEESIDKAVEKGDIVSAEQLSDKLATREMAVKITKAVSCHKYVSAKEEQEALQESQKKRKKLAWGFEAKQRWETKSNMGFM